eukprot:gene18028-19834_t
MDSDIEIEEVSLLKISKDKLQGMKRNKFMERNNIALISAEYDVGTKFQYIECHLRICDDILDSSVNEERRKPEYLPCWQGKKTEWDISSPEIVVFAAPDPFYKNIFQQTTTEVQNQQLTAQSGQIPAWLDGDFVRQNCASFGNIDGGKYEQVAHLFDCIPMVGRYSIQNGTVKYSNKQYRTRPRAIWEFYGNNMSESKVCWHTLFSPIDIAAYNRSKKISYNSSLPLAPTVNFWRSRPEDPVFAVTESIFSPTELKLRPELDILGLYQGFKTTGFPSYLRYGNYLHWFYDNPAHEQVDPDGTIWTSTFDIEPPVVSPTKKLSGLEAAIIVYKILGKNRTMAARYVLGKYSVANCSSSPTPQQKKLMPGYSHFVQTTPGYILVPQTSYRFDHCLDFENRDKVMPGFLKSYKWHPDVNTSILVFDRNNMSNVQHVTLPYAKFFTHDMNAYEDATHMYLDTLAYDNADAYLRLPLIKEALAGYNWSASFLRIAIDKRSWSFDAMKSGPLTTNDPYGKAEFPMINYEGHHQRDYTFVYFVANALYRESKIGKLNVKTKQEIYWTPPTGYYPQEPIFVPEEGATEEDRGVILCSGPISKPAGTSFLAVLNATDLTQIALVQNPNAALFGLHNRFYKAASTPPVTTKPSTSKKPPVTSSGAKTQQPTTPSTAMANSCSLINFISLLFIQFYVLR